MAPKIEENCTSAGAQFFSNYSIERLGKHTLISDYGRWSSRRTIWTKRNSIWKGKIHEERANDTQKRLESIDSETLHRRWHLHIFVFSVKVLTAIERVG